MSIIVSLMLLMGGMQTTEAPAGLIQKGKASFYSTRFHGRKTAYGERFDVAQMTAAHRTLPHNTLVEVTNLDNNKSVIVRINDRGPHTKGRIIDLGYSAAKAIGMISRGVATVAIRVVGKHRLALKPAVSGDLPDVTTASLVRPELLPPLQ